jgi:amino acid transporter
LRAGALGAPRIVFLVLAMVGPLASLMGDSPFIFGAAGAAAPLIILAAIVIILLFGTALVAISRHIASAGGFVVFVAHAFGDRAGAAMAFMTQFAYFMATIAVYGAAGAFGAAALQQFFGWHVPFGVLVGVAVVAVATLTFLDVTISVAFVGTLFACEALIMFIFDVVVLAKGGTAAAHPASSFSITPLVHGNVPMALIWAVALFGGFEISVVFSEEARNSRSTIRRATYTVVLLLGSLYLLTMFALDDVYPAGGVIKAAETNPTGFIYGPAQHYIGTTLTDIMQALVVTSFFASLVGVHGVLSRYLFSFGRGHMVPAVFGRTHPRFKSPYVANFTMAGLSAAVLAACVIGGLNPFSQILGWFGSVAALGTEITFGIAALAIGVVIGRLESRGRWRNIALVASYGAFIATGLVSYFTIHNFPAIIGSTGWLSWLWLAYPAFGVAGYLTARYYCKTLDFSTGKIGAEAH